MYAEVPSDPIIQLKDHLEEGKIVVIKKFLVERAKSAFKVAQYPYMIRLNRRTIITQVAAEPPSFPRYVYTLTPLSALQQYTNRTKKFLDVIGQITIVPNAAIIWLTNERQQVKRIIILQYLSGTTIEVSLWGSRATEFDGDLVHQIGQSQPIIIIFVGTLMKQYKGPAFLSGTSACRWYINEDIPHIKEFYARMTSKLEPVEKIELHSNNLIQTQIEEKTVLQLKEIDPFE
ncbi:replication protein A 70 kDa DNA-binding subunit A-like [Phragmites australis]|uniref:replication protein A 70 kDa DNA-binding subunit A-like n=1 Tax=Phragmites australis TaxID=29695 RepID=UPI002D76E52F|nr:replication protein A 70 kDa DNA-binding subunit A-like [Phragmites australis]